MKQIEDNIEDEEDYKEDYEEDYEEQPSFGETLCINIAPPIKQFLINYLGDALNDAPAQTFRAIEQLIKDNILLFANQIPEDLYRYRTITDSNKWDDALADFKRNEDAVFPWPQKEKWYNIPDNEDEEDDADNDELPAEAKKVIIAVDKFLDDHNKFKTFMQQSCPIIIKEIQQYVEKCAVFDLTILSAEGYIAVQTTITMLAETLAEDLHAVTAEL
jgi:hypothetical protein